MDSDEQPGQGPRTEVVSARGEGRELAVAKAVSALQSGDAVVLPTDTVYGVAADAFNTSATRNLFVVKRRARSVPLPVLIRSPKQMLGLVTRVSKQAERLMAAYWPGPVTLVVAADENLSWDLGLNQGTVAVRMPFDEVTLDVIRATGPLAVTSANLHGKPAAQDVATAQAQLGNRVRVYLDDGPRQAQMASAVVDLTRGEPFVLRSGVIPDDELLGVARGLIDTLDATQVVPPADASPAVDAAIESAAEDSSGFDGRDDDDLTTA